MIWITCGWMLLAISLLFPNNSNGHIDPNSYCFTMNRQNQMAPPVSQIESLIVASMKECAIKCSRKLPDCISVSYNDQTKKCILQRTFSDDQMALPVDASGFKFLDMNDPVDVCLSEQPCKNNGICTDGFGTDYSCECTELYTGKNCSQRVGQILLIGSIPRATSELEIYTTEETAFNRTLNTTLAWHFAHVSGVFDDGTVAIAGGYKDGSTSSDTDLYDPKQDQVTEGPAMNEIRTFAAAAMLDNEMIVCGGSVTTAINSCEKLFFNQSSSLFEWQQITPPNLARKAAAMATANGKIFIMGGLGITSLKLSETERYDTTTSTWSYVAQMITARSYLAAAELNGYIYACGGQNNKTIVNTCEKYDPAADSWSTTASMTTPRMGFSMVSINGKIYALGSYSGGLSSVEEYDPSTNTWTMAEPMKTVRGFHSAVPLI